MSGRWVDLREAAELLGTSTEGVRRRAATGSLPSDRRDGRVLVWVDEGRTEGGRDARVDREASLEDKDETIRTLREQLEAEQRANEENRRLLAALVQWVPELESPQESSGDPKNGASRREGVESRPATGGARDASERLRDTAEYPLRGSLARPWWRRVVGR